MMNSPEWRERLIEETKKEIIREAREKQKSLRYSERFKEVEDSQEKLGKLKKLQELQRNYDYLQRELLNRSLKPSPNPSFSNSPDLQSKDLSSESMSKASALQHHLDHMQLLQKRAKQILQKEKIARMAPIPEAPVLNEKLLRKKRQEQVELKIPVFVPLSTIRKEKHMPPRLVTHVTGSGEVMPVYFVGEPGPRYDPLVKVYQSIPNQNNGKLYRDSVDATAHSQQNASVDSVFYYRIFKKEKANEATSFTPQPGKELVEAPINREDRPLTPTGLPNVWNFRELEQRSPMRKPNRKWVKERMEQYYEKRVKKNFLPKIDANKSLEIQMNIEKTHTKPKTFSKVKLL